MWWSYQIPGSFWSTGPRFLASFRPLSKSVSKIMLMAYLRYSSRADFSPVHSLAPRYKQYRCKRPRGMCTGRCTDTDADADTDTDRYRHTDIQSDSI